MRIQYDLTADNSGRTDPELVTTVLGEEECVPSHSFGPYIREYFLIHYCVSGKGTFFVNGKSYDVSIVEGMKEVAQSSSSSNAEGFEVKAPVPGAILNSTSFPSIVGMLITSPNAACGKLICCS